MHVHVGGASITGGVAATAAQDTTGAKAVSEGGVWVGGWDGAGRRDAMRWR